MKFLQSIVALILISTLLSISSCVNCIEPTGEQKTRSLKLDDFKKIELEIPANVKLIIGDSSMVRVSAPESIISQILLVVKNNRLNIEGNICPSDNSNIDIEITTPHVSSLKIKGSGNIFCETPIRTDDLSLKIKGSGKISLNVFANDIDVDISGTGDINLLGTCKNLDVNIDGSGSFKGLGINSYKAKVKITGSGIATVVALNNLTAKVDGSGEIKYSGEPKLSIDINGNGKITKIQ